MGGLGSLEQGMAMNALGFYGHVLCAYPMRLMLMPGIHGPTRKPWTKHRTVF